MVKHCVLSSTGKVLAIAETAAQAEKDLDRIDREDPSSRPHIVMIAYNPRFSRGPQLGEFR